MPLDPSIPLMATKFESYNDFSARKAEQDRQRKVAEFQMKQAEDQQMQQQNLQNAYAQAWTPDGGLDENKLISAIGANDPMTASKLQADFKSRQLKSAMDRLDLSSKLLDSVYDEGTYQQALSIAHANGIDTRSLPANYDPAAIDSMRMNLLGIKDKVQLQLNSANVNSQIAHRGNMESIAMRGQNMVDARARDNAAKTPQAGKPASLSPTVQKAVFEADDNAQAAENALGMLKKAKGLNDQAYSGFGAKTRAVLASNFGNLTGSESAAANATVELDNLMTTQALEVLKATFGGMPTEGERKILLDIQASADKTPAQRGAILDRAIAAAERRMKFNKSKANSLRSGTYFQPQQEQPQETSRPPLDSFRR